MRPTSWTMASGSWAFPENNLLKSDVVLFPSEAAPYESEQALIAEIREFIHRYVDVSPLFEEIASYYVLFTWVYDAFDGLPVPPPARRHRNGKDAVPAHGWSAVLQAHLCERRFDSLAAFRILDSVRGTLIIDEGDFRFSDEKAEIVKI